MTSIEAGSSQEKDQDGEKKLKPAVTDKEITYFQSKQK